MKKQYLVTEEQVKKALKISDFRYMSKDKIMEFASLIPQMDKEVAIAIINQFPNYVEYTLGVTEQLNKACDRVIQSNEQSQKEVVISYKFVLETIREELKRDDISTERRDELINEMINIADKISFKDTENKKWLQKTFTKVASVIWAAVLLGAVLLGANAKGNEIPSLDEEEEENEDEINT